MKARHSIFPREISSPQGNMVQMKVCNENVLSKVAALPLFVNCSRKDVDDILDESRGMVRQFDAGEVILHECLPADSLVAVISGCVLVRECGLSDDVRHLVQRIMAGGTFGATFVALAPALSPGMLVAEYPSEVLFLEVASVRQIMNEGRHLRFLANLYAAACTQGFYAWRKLMLLSCYEIGERVLLYLKWRREDGLVEPAKFRYGDLAEYLGVNRTALYRVLAKLQKSGKIRIADNTIDLA